MRLGKCRVRDDEDAPQVSPTSNFLEATSSEEDEEEKEEEEEEKEGGEAKVERRIWMPLKRS